MSIVQWNVYPDLAPKMVDQQWFEIDKHVDMNAELKELEEQEKTRLANIRQRGKEILPIGKTSHDNSDDEDDNNDDDYDDDDNDDDEEEDDDSAMNDEYSEPIE